MADHNGKAQPRLEVLEGGRDFLEREIATVLFTPDGVPQANGQTGDLFAEIQIVLPEPLDDQTIELLRKISQQRVQDPRTKLQW